MAERTPVASGRIFVSYRREETAYPAGWLYERLAERFGAHQVFKDVDSIQLGDDFVERARLSPRKVEFRWMVLAGGSCGPVMSSVTGLSARTSGKCSSS